MCRCRELELPRSHRPQQSADGVWVLSRENRRVLAELQVCTGKIMPCRSIKRNAKSRFIDDVHRLSQSNQVTGLAIRAHLIRRIILRGTLRICSTHAQSAFRRHFHGCDSAMRLCHQLQGSHLSRHGYACPALERDQCNHEDKDEAAHA